MILYCQKPDDLFFVDNETNNMRLWNSSSNPTPYPKDGINDHVVNQQNTINPALTGTKASASYQLEVASQATCEIRLRLSANLKNPDPFGADFDTIFQTRIAEADEFYQALALPSLTTEERLIQRQAYAGMLWSKQFYYYIITDWLKGDPATPPPPPNRTRNADWTHFYAKDVISMPDAWEYPWFASWDLCFQSVVFARLDVEFAKNQLRLLAHEWYMSPKGAIPAYEWNFGDVNPPLHPWAALHIFDIEKEMRGVGDIQFLEDIFQHCLLYFTWWANQEDSEHKNLFQGGFLGLDNISIIDRSHLSSFEAQIGRSVELFQSDGTIWMGMFSLNMLEIAIKLVEGGLTEYTPLATKFFQNAVFIADAFNNIQHHGANGLVNLWDDTDGFYYDVLKVHSPDEYYPIKLRSLVGLMALFPTLNLDLTNTTLVEQIMSEPMQWFLSEHPEVTEYALTQKDNTNQFLLSFVNEDRLRIILKRVFDQVEFLSPHGIRGISKVYQNSPYSLTVNGVNGPATLTEQYEPAESSEGLFGGNSNWRGPVWFPINFLLIEKLTYYYDFLGDDFTIEYPTGSGQKNTLREISDDLSQRLIQIFKKDTQGNRPVYGGNQTFQKDPTWQNLFLFYEYFHGDNGAGIGASHQTGWTGLVAELLNRSPKKGNS